ncbi:hypothetical protein Indivirus_5_13 [Indivirus ILV1]|uniref:Uncharacterized protein n=1 Tax=Indivirus ILV1 TaxID=1977633 RepID=A0A1V0SDT5_9VIRU|nr:hypothetical protein Indivirus_5_13 [Indivirus ILV1]
MVKQLPEELNLLKNEIKKIPLRTVYMICASQVIYGNQYLEQILLIENPERYTFKSSVLFMTQTGYSIEFNDGIPSTLVQYTLIINLHNDLNKNGLIMENCIINESFFHKCFIHPRLIGDFNNIKSCKDLKYILINQIQYDDIPLESIIYIKKETEKINLYNLHHMNLINDYICDIRNMINDIIKNINNYDHQVKELKNKKKINEEIIKSIISNLPNMNIFNEFSVNLKEWMNKSKKKIIITHR